MIKLLVMINNGRITKHYFEGHIKISIKSAITHICLQNGVHIDRERCNV